MQPECELILASLTFICLSIGMIQDIKTRYTSNKLWLTQGGLGFLIILTCGLLRPYEPLELIGIFMNIAFALFFGFLFFYIGAWGAGDSKAMFALGFSSPVVFSFIPMDIPPEMSVVPLFLIILNFIASIVIMLIVIMGINLWNLYKCGSWFKETSGTPLKKIAVLLTSYQVPPSKLSATKFLDPVESYDGNWRLEFSIFEDYNEDDDVLEAREIERRNKVKSDAENTGRTCIWVRPQIPGLAIFWLSYAIWLFHGSLGLPMLQALISFL